MLMLLSWTKGLKIRIGNISKNIIILFIVSSYNAEARDIKVKTLSKVSENLRQAKSYHPTPDIKNKLFSYNTYQSHILNNSSNNNEHYKLSNSPNNLDKNRSLISQLQLYDFRSPKKKNRKMNTGLNWEAIDDDYTQSKDELNWEVIDINYKQLQDELIPVFTRFLTLEDVDRLMNQTNLLDSDFNEILRHSASVPTALILERGKWQINTSIISTFRNQGSIANTSIITNLDIGVHEKVFGSIFYSKLLDSYDSLQNNVDKEYTLFWESYGTAGRFELLKYSNWQVSVNGSLEVWRIFEGEQANSSIYKGSDKELVDNNIIGSIALPLTWDAADSLQFSIAPVIAFLPRTQSLDDNTDNTFYGTNTFVGGGIHWRPNRYVGITASLAQPIGNSTNKITSDLHFRQVPIFSAGLNWNPNPRINLYGHITNGFGGTPATSILALPIDDQLGYFLGINLIPVGLDTPQADLTSRQNALAKSGLSVNTALIPPDDQGKLVIGADIYGSGNGFLSYSLSNIFEITLLSGSKTTGQPHSSQNLYSFFSDETTNWNISGKIIGISPLRNAPLWAAGRISLGRNNKIWDNSDLGYILIEAMSTWEATKNLAININPKLAISETSSTFGIGLSTNLQLLPNVELISEANIIHKNDSFSQSNGTIGIRCGLSPTLDVDIYGTTAASLVDIGQLLGAGRIRWGGRVIYSF